MKKITFLITFLFLSFVCTGQHSFTTDTNVYTVPDNSTIITVDVNDPGNTASTPAGLYSTYSVTVDWSISGGNAWSSEARLAVGTSAGTTARASSPDGAGSTASVTMTFEGTLPDLYDPSVDGLLFLELSRTFSSPDDWTNISVTIFPAPACGEPTDLLSFVNDTSTLFAWTEPVSGTPTGYNWEVQPDGVAQGTPGALASGTTTDTTVNSGMVLTASTAYEFYIRTDCGVDGTSVYATTGFTTSANPTPQNDSPYGATPITPSAEGTGCGSATFTLPFSTDGTTDSGIQGSCSNSGKDQFFTWTATTDGLIFSSSTPGDPGIVIWDANTLTEIDCSDTFETDFVLSGWAVNQDLIIQIYDFSGSNSDVAFCLEQFTLPSSVPNCAEMPISPMDGATGVAVGTPVTVTWTAPSTGETPTSYDFYAGVESDGSDLALVTNVAATTTDITFNFYSTTYYWQVVPKNSLGDATGCPLWSFTTEDFAGSTPTTLQTITINSCGDMQTATNSYDASVEGIQWIELVYSGGCQNIVIDTDSTTGFTDTELGIYNTDGNLIASDDDGGAGALSLLTLNGLEAGTYYVAAGAFNVTYSPGFNASSSSTTASGSMVIDFVSGATLSNDEFTKSQFTFYPNPTKDVLHFNSVETIDEITVYNLLGQEVLRQNSNSLDPEINLSNLKSGNYFVKVKIENRIKTIKIIKN